MRLVDGEDDEDYEGDEFEEIDALTSPRKPLSVALDLPPPWQTSPGAPSVTPRPPTVRNGSKTNSFGFSEAAQIVPSLLVASFALALTGGLLDKAQHWSMFEKRTAYFIAMPMLFGLKGNLDMTLASRLSSAMHAGRLGSMRSFYESGMALVMVQAILCGLLAGIFTVIMAAIAGTGGNSRIEDSTLNFDESLSVVASVMLTSMLAAFFFGLCTFALVMGGKRLGCDPDNIATPLVSSVGDMASLVVLACCAFFIDWFADWGGIGITAPVVIMCFAVGALPFLWCMAAKDKVCREALRTGWLPILASLGISQFAGSMLESTIVSYQGIGIFVLYINGFGGNLACIYASRLCSMLHTTKGRIESTWTVGTFLMVVGFMFQSAYLTLVHMLDLGHANVTLEFSAIYLFACAVHISLLLLLTRFGAPTLYSKHVDPDNFMTPLITAVGDLAGTALIAVVFMVST